MHSSYQPEILVRRASSSYQDSFQWARERNFRSTDCNKTRHRARFLFFVIRRSPRAQFVLISLAWACYSLLAISGTKTWSIQEMIRPRYSVLQFPMPVAASHARWLGWRERGESLGLSLDVVFNNALTSPHQSSNIAKSWMRNAVSEQNKCRPKTDYFLFSILESIIFEHFCWSCCCFRIWSDPSPSEPATNRGCQNYKGVSASIECK